MKRPVEKKRDKNFLAARKERTLNLRTAFTTGERTPYERGGSGMSKREKDP